MRIKCITGTFTDEEIWVEITDAEQESAGDIVTPDQYDWVENNYPRALKTVESKLFYVCRKIKILFLPLPDLVSAGAKSTLLAPSEIVSGFFRWYDYEIVQFIEGLFFH